MTMIVTSMRSFKIIPVEENGSNRFVLVKTLVSIRLRCRISLARTILSYLLYFYLLVILKTMVWKHEETWWDRKFPSSTLHPYLQQKKSFHIFNKKILFVSSTKKILQDAVWLHKRTSTCKEIYLQGSCQKQKDIYLWVSPQKDIYLPIVWLSVYTWVCLSPQYINPNTLLWHNGINTIVPESWLSCCFPSMWYGTCHSCWSS